MNAHKKKITIYPFSEMNRVYCLVRLYFIVLLAVGISLPLVIVDVEAQTCIPPVVGVPYSGGPGPIWWDSTPTNSSAIYHRVNDPRWKTSLRIGHGSGSTEQASFRALHHTDGGVKSVYMSWWINVAPYINTDEPTHHQVYLGLKPKTGTKRLFVKLEMITGSNVANSPSDVNADVHIVGTSTNSNMVSTRIDPDPQWTVRSHIWIQKLQNYANSTITDANMWAININIPIGVDLGDGVILGDEFYMFYNILTDAGPLGAVEGDPVIDYDWPIDTEVTVDAMERKILPDISNWEEVVLSSGVSDSECSTGGITIEAMDIGTDHPDGQGYIALNSTNTFFARPTNKTGGNVAVGNVHAKFSLANWGNEPDKFSVDPETIWTEVRGLGDVTQSAPPVDISDESQWNITGNWTPNSTDDPIWFDGSRQNHQCMLVELSGSEKFLKSSVHRNMNFRDASVYRENAQVSVVGLEPISAAPRDVYLYVQKKNMPRRLDRGDMNSNRNPKLAALSYDRNDAGIEDDERTKIDKIADTMPTYVVHAYYDSGRTIIRKGRTQKILKPMTSYGYFMEHEGPLLGWKTEIKGSTLVELSPNFYKVVVPNNGTSTVTNTIEAVEHTFAINAHIGAGFPHGSFDNYVDPGASLNIGLEYLYSPSFSAELIIGYHQFKDDGLGDDLDIYQLSLNGRYYLPHSFIRSYINAGFGVYDLSPGDTELGSNFGVGVQYDLTSQLSLEGAYNFHYVDTNNPDVQFSTLQIGLRYQF